MSRSQEKALKIATGIIVPIIAVLVALGTYKQQMMDTVKLVGTHEVRLDKVDVHMERQTTNQEWIMDSLKRIEADR